MMILFNCSLICFITSKPTTELKYALFRRRMANDKLPIRATLFFSYVHWIGKLMFESYDNAFYRFVLEIETEIKCKKQKKMNTKLVS